MILHVNILKCDMWKHNQYYTTKQYFVNWETERRNKKWENIQFNFLKLILPFKTYFGKSPQYNKKLQPPLKFFLRIKMSPDSLA